MAKAAGAGEVISVVDILANSSLEDLEFSDDESKLSDTEPQVEHSVTSFSRFRSVYTNRCVFNT